MIRTVLFTIGPWTVETATKYSRGVFAGQQQSLIATAHGDARMNLPAELDANAALIAAAPDLYIALTNALDYLHDILGQCEEDCTCMKHALEAAIAKAEGHRTDQS